MVLFYKDGLLKLVRGTKEVVIQHHEVGSISLDQGGYGYNS
jgi:hypothetical protein